MNAPKGTSQPLKKPRHENTTYLDTPKFIRMGEAYKEVEIRARKATPNDWSDFRKSKKLCETALQKFRNGFTDTLTPQELSVVKKIIGKREDSKIDPGGFSRLPMSERYRAVVKDLEQLAKKLASEIRRVEQEKGAFYKSLVRRIETSKVPAANLVYIRMSNEERVLCLGAHQKMKNFALGELSNEELSVIKFLVELRVQSSGFNILMFSSRYDLILGELERYGNDPLRKKA